MNISRLARGAERLIADNSPLILTALGVAGTIGTAFFTGKATFHAAKILDDARFAKTVRDNNTVVKPAEALTKTEKFKLLWKVYLPAAGVMTLTCTSIILAHKINVRRAAVVAGIATLERDNLIELKERVEKRLGKKEGKEFRDEGASKRVNEWAAACDEDMVIDTGIGKTLFLDSYTMRAFRSSIPHVKQAENEILAQLLREGYATQSEWFNKLKLEHTVMSEALGWDSDDQFEVEHVPSMIKEGPLKGEPCLYLVYEPDPRLRPWKSKD